MILDIAKDFIDMRNVRKNASGRRGRKQRVNGLREVKLWRF